MAKRTRYSEYHDRYANYRLELSDDGILLMQCHTNGGSLVWDWRAHDQMSDAFADIAGDREIKVLIHTGTGENYNANWGRMPNGDPVEKPDYVLMPGTRGLLKLDEKAWYARHLITNVLDVDVPMISAVNGPCNMHSEVPLLGDIVLASEDAYFQDASHFPRGQVPGEPSHANPGGASPCPARPGWGGTGQAQRPRDCPAALGPYQAFLAGVQVRAPARPPRRRIGNYLIPYCHQAKQVGLGRAHPATHARPDWRRRSARSRPGRRRGPPGHYVV